MGTTLGLLRCRVFSIELVEVSQKRAPPLITIQFVLKCGIHVGGQTPRASGFPRTLNSRRFEGDRNLLSSHDHNANS